MKSDRGSPTSSKTWLEHVEFRADADKQHNDLQGPDSEQVSHQGHHSQVDDDAIERRDLDLLKVLPALHKLLLHLRQLKKRRETVAANGS
jgi:hypothetical protein